MPGYGMTIGSPASFGGGGIAGLGDLAPAIYTGLDNAMPMLTRYYNFQHARMNDQLNNDAYRAQQQAVKYGNEWDALKNYYDVQGLLAKRAQGLAGQTVAGIQQPVAPTQADYLQQVQDRLRTYGYDTGRQW